jgi:Cytochrome P460
MRISRQKWTLVLLSSAWAICAFVTRAADHAAPDLPAPLVDRVGYPAGYREKFVRVRISDRPDSKTTAVIYANAAGATVRPGSPGPYPYGSILVNETWDTVKDAAGRVVLDEGGHYKLADLQRVHVMRKEEGYGEAYLENRSGEWEYVSFGPAGNYLTPPAKSGACAQCHQMYATEARDWVFGKYEKH